MSANPFNVALTGSPDFELVDRALSASGRFIMTAGGFYADAKHPHVWVEVEGPGEQIHPGAWTLVVEPDEDLKVTRHVAHEVSDMLQAAGIDAFVFQNDPDFPDPIPDWEQAS